MEYQLLKKKFVDLELTETQKKYVHYNSVLNFLTHYDLLRNDVVKQKVKDLLDAYYHEIIRSNCMYDSNSSYEIGLKYITEIGKYYSFHLGFRQELKISSVLFWGLMADALLLFGGLLKRLYYIPICTLLLLAWYCYLLRFKLAGKTYGLYY
jgi:hypothetical protein